ncbi:MAG: hypothetical protein FJ022_01375 [Chloroflexi bacterium]|nr:hypothetical protein [Chloroflexota bacterium]MBM3174315.1 hypothetical protein [Chloroflexota bacterium]MBM4449446.1 hypothetical protein [Chloroflexota bacterium]
MDNSQRLGTILGLMIAMVILCSGTAFISYSYGQHIGYSSGYQSRHQSTLSQMDVQIQAKQADYQAGYEAGRQAALKDTSNRFSLRNPTFQETMDFLARDKTNENKYVEGQYVCVDFSHEVNNNAEAQGIRCAVVDIFYPEGKGHTIVAFETTDKGLQFVEPQFDHLVSVEVGKSYSQTNRYKAPPGDDTILRYLITW